MRKVKPLSLARVKQVARIAMERCEIDGKVLRAEWIGKVSAPKSGPVILFRAAFVWVESKGKVARKLVTVEQNGGWRLV